MPISPTPSFVTKIRYLATSLRCNGGALADSSIVVTVGADAHERVDLAHVHPWSRELGIEWRWLDETLWRRHGIFGTALQRFRYPVRTPLALMLDADMLCAAPIDDLLQAAQRAPAIAGVPAHISPFADCEEGQQLWQRIFAAAGLGPVPLECEHSGWQAIEFDPGRRLCPPYFNLGFLLASRQVLRSVGRTIYQEMETVERIHETPFRCQIALTLAILRARVAWRALPLRFNFPNDAHFLARYASELDDVRVIHYLRDEQVDRAVDLASVDGVRALLARADLNPVNARLQQELRELHPQVLCEA